MSKTDVLVVGAGPVGMTLAAMLHHQGLRDFRLVDRSPQPNGHSRAVIVRTRSLELLHKLGLARRVVEAGVACRRVTVWADGSQQMQLELEGVDSPYRDPVLIPQSETERVLREHLDAIEHKPELRVLEQLEDRRDSVICQLRAPDGQVETVEARAVVGCDGAASTVRTAIQVATVAARAPAQSWTMADVGVDGDVAPDEVSTFLHPDGTVMLFPLGRDLFRLVVENREIADLPELTLESLQTEVTTRTRRRLTLHHPRWMNRQVVRGFTAQTFSRGRVFLAGDAAHVLSPLGAQGMNAGIQDAFNLAWKLALVVERRCDIDVLGTYTAERHAILAAAASDLDRRYSVSALTGKIGQSLRNGLMRFLDCLDFVSNRSADEVAQISIVYPESLIVGESRHRPSGGVAPGRRVPDADLLEWRGHAEQPVPTTLFDVLRTPRHVLLLCNGLRPTLEDTGKLAAAARHMAVDHEATIEIVLVSTEAVEDWFGRVLVDQSGQLHARLGATEAALYLVRPDGYLGYRASTAGAADLQAWTDRLFKG